MSSKTRLTETDGTPTPTVNPTDSDVQSLISKPPSEEPIQREQIFEILSNERRRLVLRYLRQHSEDDVDFRQLVDHVAAWENGTTCDRLDSSDRKCVYTALRQTHLPKLDSFGVIEFDHQRGSIEPNESLDDVLLYMKYVPEREVFWSRLYLALAVVCGLSVLLIWGGIVPFGSIPGTAVALGIAVTFGASSIAQMYQSHQVGMHLGEPNRD